MQHWPVGAASSRDCRNRLIPGIRRLIAARMPLLRRREHAPKHEKGAARQCGPRLFQALLPARKRDRQQRRRIRCLTVEIDDLVARVPPLVGAGADGQIAIVDPDTGELQRAFDASAFIGALRNCKDEPIITCAIGARNRSCNSPKAFRVHPASAILNLAS